MKPFTISVKGPMSCDIIYLLSSVIYPFSQSSLPWPHSLNFSAVTVANYNNISSDIFKERVTFRPGATQVYVVRYIVNTGSKSYFINIWYMFFFSICEFVLKAFDTNRMSVNSRRMVRLLSKITATLAWWLPVDTAWVTFLH